MNTMKVWILLVLSSVILTGCSFARKDNSGAERPALPIQTSSPSAARSQPTGATTNLDQSKTPPGSTELTAKTIQARYFIITVPDAWEIIGQSHVQDLVVLADKRMPEVFVRVTTFLYDTASKSSLLMDQSLRDRTFVNVTSPSGLEGIMAIGPATDEQAMQIVVGYWRDGFWVQTITAQVPITEFETTRTLLESIVTSTVPLVDRK